MTTLRAKHDAERRRHNARRSERDDALEFIRFQRSRGLGDDEIAESIGVARATGHAISEAVLVELVIRTGAAMRDGWRNNS